MRLRLYFLLWTPIFLLVSCKNNKQEPNEIKVIKEVKVAEVPFERQIKLDGQVNFRDLGNYETQAGYEIKTGMLYRSGRLSDLSDKDVERLEELGIKTVVNFLSLNEIEYGGADRLPGSVKLVSIPIEGEGDELDELIVARKTGNFKSIPTDFNYQIHKILPETGKAQYAELIEILSDSTNYPLVFHCSHGIHRTGTAAAIILSLLEVPWETTVEDYLLSNVYRKEEADHRIEALDSMARVLNTDIDFEKNREYIVNFYTLQEEYIQGTQNHILATYGSFENYAYEAGVREEELASLKEILLKK